MTINQLDGFLRQIFGRQSHRQKIAVLEQQVALIAQAVDEGRCEPTKGQELVQALQVRIDHHYRGLARIQEN